MAIEFDSTGTQAPASGTIFSFPQTITGRNTLLLVHFTTASATGTVISAPKFGGSSLTRIIGVVSGGNKTTELWYLKSPPLGLGTLNGTLTTNAGCVVSMSVRSVNQSTPILGSASAIISLKTIGTVASAISANNWWSGAWAGGPLGDAGTVSTGIQRVRGTISGGGLSMMASNTAGTMVWTSPSTSAGMLAAEVNNDAGSIAFDAAGSFSQTSGSVFTWAHTVTGANTLMIAQIGHTASIGTVVGIKFAGVNMTRIIAGTNGRSSELWYLVAPASGLGTLTGTFSAANAFENNGVSVSVTGVNQTTPIQGSASNNWAVGATSGSVNLTTATDTSWLVGGASLTSVTGVAEDLTTGQVSRIIGPGLSTETRMSTNGPISPAGASKLRYTFTSAGGAATVAEVNPAAAAGGGGAVNQTFKTLLGAGNI